MTKENIQEFAVALNSSPSEGAGEGSEAKRNKKTQLLSALLSASALGVFLEGCGGGVTGDGSESNPFVATAGPDTFDGIWASYAGSNEGIKVELRGTTIAPVGSTVILSGGWAEGDTLRNIRNVIGSRFADTLNGDSRRNTLRGGEGDDILEGEGGDDKLEGGPGRDDYIFRNSHDDDEIRSDPDGGRLLFPISPWIIITSNLAAMSTTT